MVSRALQPDACLACVVAGHVDHGKSTLIGSLARELSRAGVPMGAMDVGATDPAFFTDRLQEEREGRMTVDRAAVRFDLPDGHLTLIDVPGHAEFLRNMLTGATQATVGILVVAADEGIRPQTIAHAKLMAFCGIRRIVLAVSKMDCAGWSREACERLRPQVGELFAGTGSAVVAVVPVAAPDGANIVDRGGVPAWCGGTLLDALLAELRRPAPADAPPPARFAVQGILRLPGLPPLCTGRVVGGRIGAGDCLREVGGTAVFEVKRIRRFPERPDAALPGENVALELAGPALPRRGTVLEAEGGETPFLAEMRARVAWLDAVPEDGWLDCQWLYQTVPARIVHSAGSVPYGTLGDFGLLHIADTVLSVVTFRPALSFWECPELGRFVLWRGSRMIGAGVVTGWGTGLESGVLGER